MTLTKQLQLKEYKPVDWATNALTLSHHYVINDRFADAKAHLVAARFVLDRHRAEWEAREAKEEEDDDEKEAIDRASAKIERAWGKYCLVLLQRSQEAKLFRAQSGEGGDDLRVEDLEGDRADELQLFEGLKCSFPDVDPDAVRRESDVPTKLAATFEEARSVFLPGQRAIKRAQEEYFSLEHHCLDFTELNQDLSCMTKILVFFEPDWDRKFKIHKRRLELLEGPLGELSPAHYLLLCRQLLFELGEVNESLMDVKLDQCKAQGQQVKNHCIALNLFNVLCYGDTYVRHIYALYQSIIISIDVFRKSDD